MVAQNISRLHDQYRGHRMFVQRVDWSRSWQYAIDSVRGGAEG
jgi:hypothetical protein